MSSDECFETPCAALHVSVKDTHMYMQVFLIHVYMKLCIVCVSHSQASQIMMYMELAWYNFDKVTAINYFQPNGTW